MWWMYTINLQFEKLRTHQEHKILQDLYRSVSIFQLLFWCQKNSGPWEQGDFSCKSVFNSSSLSFFCFHIDLQQGSSLGAVVASFLPFNFESMNKISRSTSNSLFIYLNAEIGRKTVKIFWGRWLLETLAILNLLCCSNFYSNNKYICGWQQTFTSQIHFLNSIMLAFVDLFFCTSNA